MILRFYAFFHFSISLFFIFFNKFNWNVWKLTSVSMYIKLFLLQTVILLAIS